jgi:hypothetical protein
MKIIIRNVTTSGAQRVQEALNLLQFVAPGHYAHFFREITRIDYAPVACDGGVACTAGRYGRAAVLATNPEHENLIELAVLLSHEARHHHTDQSGRHLIIPHTCQDCTDPIERALDSIYQEDERLRRAIHMYLRDVRERTGGPSLVEGLLTVAGVGLAVVWTVSLISAIVNALDRRHAV